MSTTTAIREALAAELAAQCAQHHFNQTERLHWLVVHIEEYVDRLGGFSLLPHTTQAALLTSDFFKLISVAAEMMDDELVRMGGAKDIEALWQSFSHELTILAKQNEKGGASRLLTVIQQVRSHLEGELHNPDR